MINNMKVNKDIECPYCGAEQDINHNDGYGYEQNEKHSQMCEKCGKEFVYETTIVFYYDVSKAECLNGAPHNFRLTHTYPQELSKMRCSVCSDERELTAEERKIFGIGTIADYVKSLKSK
jgi:DNA-directed RNA polymerase subunit RPC12/RpoP